MHSEGRIPPRQGTDLKEAEAAARKHLGEIGRDLEAIRFRLLGVEAILPAGALETVDLVEVEEMDARTELRSVVQHLLTDLIEPAIRDLRTSRVLR
ncbi:MAG TPA: hypothetical protein VGX68_06570 [Thermoanaerobaculia bacterium]|jgi:hypothetical protein|nr:hypothetical protein [Thermoanaerobaculia bacterium]